MRDSSKQRCRENRVR